MSICKTCHISFTPKAGTKGIYHSYQCYWDDLKGKPIAIDNFGRTPWNKGKKGVQKGFWAGKKRPEISAMKLGKKRPEISGKNNKNWKGDEAKYAAIHMWLRGNFGFPDTCEHCGKSGLTGKKIHWANVSGEYKRERGDWLRLCVPCHFTFDEQHLRERDYHGRFVQTI